MDPPNLTNQEDLQQCLSSEGIHIWGATQETLEEQALNELKLFVEENTINNKEINNGTLLEPISANTSFCEEQSIANSTHKLDFCITKDDESEISCSSNDSDTDYIPSEDEIKTVKVLKKPKVKRKSPCNPLKSVKVVDDALDENYNSRLQSYYEEQEQNLEELRVEDSKDYKKLKGGLKVPKKNWTRLYEYQKEGVFWLWELHQKPCGGLLGDEMGLGKTVQVITFLYALEYTRSPSKYCDYVGLGPTIIVCPTTVMHQWVRHFHEWAPEFQVAILHQSGSYQGQKSTLIKKIHKNKGILVTTYAGILKYKSNLRELSWHYFILDEGHKIRNPSTKVTMAVKEFQTPHKLMLTGSPMQNNLTELWSLFDFTNPGMLGDLATFNEHFATPILQGGFTNATPMQEVTALSVASTLKTIISPFLLRRMKQEVQDHIQLPHKTEQVLFCSLTDEQRQLYKEYLMSDQVNCILEKGVKSWKSDNFVKANILVAITNLRKICNHPDLFENETEDSFGSYKKSGKMIVVSALLKIWKKQGHRTLLFSQGRFMMRVFENFLNQQSYKFLKMDGSTSVSSRQKLIDSFNSDSSYDIFLLTTKVGGLGINLTGASRVIIYDPDWNPATDTQARERAWRIGQKKSVTIYRLLSAGTVEEKIYQRQVWKQLLSNKVLIDPNTNKFFKSSDLFDLFSLPDATNNKPETTNIFRESRVKIQEKLDEKKRATTTTKTQFQFSPDKVQAMRELAQKISKSLSGPSAPNKNAYQLELEEERQQKLQEREKLKLLTPQEIIEFNREKLLHVEKDEHNKLDDRVSTGTFEEALNESSKTSTVYNKVVKKIKFSQLRELKNKLKSPEEENSKKRKSSITDTSGKIDGELVEGLLKRETNKSSSKRQKLSKSDNQDNYILEHLFMKKGVSGALEHDVVLNGAKKPVTLKMRSCADEKALKSLEALKKSRLKNWKW
ncbi:hypothetical protein ABEB36_015375 [Hypothenemus hampei]|uniref:DNA repair and recombination protein RAD54-like n=1 Tax=Hypothenemus hampei TaxID=57062 RepID=A0ABD1E089_HYPHA